MVALFVYSTGRCATQALTRYFAVNLGERGHVEHEPIGARWAPRIALRHPDLPSLRRKLPEVDRHLDRIASTLAQGRAYVETGWPAFAWYPYLRSFLGQDFRWVHLVRNPFVVAGSMATHDCYGRRAIPEFAALAYLLPTDHGVTSHDLALQWHQLSQYEKSLYLWLEINRYALELSLTSGMAPALLVHYEDIFGPLVEPLRELYRTTGMGIPAIDRTERYDRHQKATILRPSLRCASLRRDVEALALELHYAPGDLNFETIVRTIHRRYSRPWRGAERTGLKMTFKFAKNSLLSLMQH